MVDNYYGNYPHYLILYEAMNYQSMTWNFSRN